jgi:hypothetical protein
MSAEITRTCRFRRVLWGPSPHTPAGGFAPRTPRSGLRPFASSAFGPRDFCCCVCVGGGRLRLWVCGFATTPVSALQLRTAVRGVGGWGYRRVCRASAAASRSAAHLTPGRLPMRSTGPETETAATTWPALSLTGAETLATPGSRSATLCAQPLLLTSRSVRSPNTASARTARWVAGSDHAASTLAPEPAVMGSLVPTGTVSRRPLGGSAARMQIRCIPSLR